MSESFDPYRQWLGIPRDQQPPNHYRLLGIQRFETEPDIISNAADRLMAHVRTFQSGVHSGDANKILNEISAVRLCLLTEEEKAVYDQQLRSQETPKVARPAARKKPKSRAKPSAAPVIAAVQEPVASVAARRRLKKNGPPRWLVPAGIGAVGFAMLAGAVALLSDGSDSDDEKNSRQQTVGTSVLEDAPQEKPAIEPTQPESQPQSTGQFPDKKPPPEPVESKPTPEEIERARLKVIEQARQAEATRIARAKQEAAERAEAKERAREQFKKDVFAQYRELGTGPVVAAEKLLEAAESEQNPVARTALALLAAERCITTKVTAKEFNAALTLAADHMSGLDLLKFKIDLLMQKEKDLPLRTDADRRLLFAQEVVSDLWPAYDVRDFETTRKADATAFLYLMDVNGANLRIGSGREKGTRLREAREALRVSSQRTERFAALNKDQSPHGLGVYLIAVQGNWSEALEHLVESSHPAVAAAAKLDAADPQSAAELFAASQAYIAAAEADSGNARLWRARGARLLQQAVAQNPTGALKLEVDLAVTALKRNRIDIEKLEGGTQGYVRGRKFVEPKVVEDAPEYELQLSGDNQYLRTSLVWDGSPMTVEAFVSPASVSRGKEVAIVGDSHYAGFTIFINKAGLYGFSVKQNGLRSYLEIESKDSAVEDQVAHVAGVFSGNRLGLFVNGVLQSTADFSATQGPGLSGKQILLGADPRGEENRVEKLFKGKIESIMISSGARYSQDFTPNHNLAEGIKKSSVVLHLDFRKGQAGGLSDRAQQPNSVVAIGEPVFVERRSVSPMTDTSEKVKQE